MRINTPFRVPRTHSPQEERDIIECASSARNAARVVALRTTGRVQIRSQINGTVRCSVLFTSEVEHFDYFRVQHAHDLQKNALGFSKRLKKKKSVFLQT